MYVKSSEDSGKIKDTAPTASFATRSRCLFRMQHADQTERRIKPRTLETKEARVKVNTVPQHLIHQTLDVF